MSAFITSVFTNLQIHSAVSETETVLPEEAAKAAKGGAQLVLGEIPAKTFKVYRLVLR